MVFRGCVAGRDAPKIEAHFKRREVLMANVTHNRPLSPHLQIYKLIPTMLMSIVHRITGGALYFGTLLVAWWLVAAASGPEYYAWVQWAMGSIIGKIVLLYRPAKKPNAKLSNLLRYNHLKE